MGQQPMRVINTRNDQTFLTDVQEARGPWQQFAGLMLRPSLPQTAGLLFRPARGIHTHFMRFPIDLIYLDERHQVQAIRPGMSPWRFDTRRAAAVIEANSGVASKAGLRVGDYLRFEPL